MAFRLNEDIGTGKRGRMTPGRALRRWEAHKGICVNCQTPIDGARDDWFCEHILALENGGTDEDENIGPAHMRCKKAKDAADHAAAGKARRNKQRHLGIKKPSRFPASRDSRWKKKLNGEVVPR